jgi:putative DNA primase/helicase
MRTLNPHTIAEMMGGEVTGPNSVNVPGPDHSPADRSLSIRLDPLARNGFIVFSHAGDDFIQCRDYVRMRLGLQNWQPSKTQGDFKSAPADRNAESRRKLALDLWSQSIHPAGTLGEKYLRNSRYLELMDDIGGRVVRFHPRMKYDNKFVPCLVLLMRDIVSDQPSAILRTFLTNDGEKISRKMLGPAKGTAVKIDEHTSVIDSLTIGEGFETALASRMAGYSPVWALGPSGSVGSFPVLSGITDLTILEENCATSRRDVKVCCERYLNAQVPVNIVSPKIGKDFNDAWREAQQ